MKLKLNKIIFNNFEYRFIENQVNPDSSFSIRGGSSGSFLLFPRHRKILVLKI